MHDDRCTLVVEDQDYRVELYEKRSLLSVLWKRHLEGEDLHEKYLTLLGIVMQFKPRYWLGNARAMYYTTLHDAGWISDNVLPALIESSITRYARIEAPQSLLMLDSMHFQDRVNIITQGLSDKFVFQFFTDEERAIGWLTS
ncbi:hypothetical protein C8N40_109139 [Pontibacter mucosus]|uniref:SpoIIAA-like protein n=1 Tax=Pontibacter mucosus TaxID=1649266 RepID=A0A2T5YE98_9BACT|nr:hypothetical protein [Pontibacter mucosus]PTX15041.1 hypothetical protein C8N40_109139 [Pontibacter mucosus]